MRAPEGRAMAGCIKGFTPIDNELYGAILRAPFTRLQLQIIYTILRFTNGYQKTTAPVSLSLIAGYLRSDRSHISTALKSLTRSHVVLVSRPASGSSARMLSVNHNTGQWALTAKVTRIAIPEKASPVLPAEHQKTLPEAQSIKENMQKNVKQIVEAVELSVLQPPQPLNNKELDQQIYTLFASCLEFRPNVYELEIIKKEIYEEERLNRTDILSLVAEAFRKVAISPREKRNTSYLLGVIRSKKQELYVEQEKKRQAAAEKVAKALPAAAEYIPGSIFSAYKAAMQQGNRQSEEPDNNIK